jgi:hypothetical protein
MVVGVVIAVARPAQAATSAPKAIGGGALNDARVWEEVGAAAGSQIRMRVYNPAASGGTVESQRWQLEMVASSSTAGITFRIHNVASGRCLDKNATNGVMISNCSTANTQRWRAPLDDPYGGWTLVNVANSQCMQVVNASTANGALIQTGACTGSAAQRWRLRTAPLDCTVRSRDWTMTDICASQSADRMRGVTANWQANPLSMTWLDPNLYVLTHTVNNYVQVQPLKPDLSPGATAVEFGRRADRSVQASGTVAYTAYWLEGNASTQQYHALSAGQAPGSDVADGRNHTFMLLGKGDAGQWDLLYDFNTVATTALQAGGSTRFSRAGMGIRYPQAVTAASPFEIRMQLLDGNGVWRRPYLQETGTGEPKTCETPPRYEDWAYDTVNLPPRCFSASLTTRAGAAPADPALTDVFKVGKPATGAVLSGHQPVATGPTPSAGFANGVDQHALAACMSAGYNDCMTRVRGLASCVAARAVCNLNRPATESSPMTPARMTAGDAVRAAGRLLDTGGRAGHTRVTTDDRGGTRTVGGFVSHGPVHVVTSTAPVHSMTAANDNVYDGYVAVFEASSQQLIYACLGADCSKTF